jgi:hypothetical protein
MCEEWRNDFAAFYAHVGPCPPGFTIERIDNEKGYFPGNVKWTSRKEQRANRRPTRPWGRKVTFNGETLYLMQWSKRLGITQKLLYKRVFERGWPIEKAFQDRSHVVFP